LSAAAFKSGIELLTYINDLYPNIIFKRHKDFNATACPGKNFPFEKMTEEVEQMTGEQIAKKLDEYYASLDMPQWAESEINEAIKLGLTDGSELCKPVPGYRAIIFALRAYKKGLNDNA